MATLADLLTEPETKVSPKVQQGRDQDALKILQTEYLKMQENVRQGKPRAESDLQAIGSEIRRLGGQVPETTYRIEATGMATGQPKVVSAGYESKAPKTILDLLETPAAPEEKTAETAVPESIKDVFTRLMYAPSDIYRTVKGGAEAAAQLGTAALAAPVAGLAGLGRAMLPGAPGVGAETTRAVQEALTYQPRTEVGKQASELVGKAFEAGAMGAPERGEKVLEATGSPAAAVVAEQLTNPLNYLPFVPAATRGIKAATAPMRETMGRWKAEIEPPQATPAVGAPGGSVGAAAATQQSQISAALSSASPELRAALEKHAPEKLDLNVINRHLDAESLPVPVRLTEGQATQDVVKLSNELNRRGKHPELAEHFNQQNQALIDNLNAMRDVAAPDAYGVRPIDNSEAIIQAYKTLDEAKRTQIREAYAKLTEANGGTLPIDTAAFLKNVDASLAKNLKTDFVPTQVSRTLDRFRNGEPMTFEQFESLRTTLAEDIRKAKRERDGNAQMASSIVLDALEKMPLSAEASGLKGLADQARSLAKQRFKALEKDPAYDAAVFDTVPADKYLDKFVIKGFNKQLNQMVQNLGENSPAHQQMAAGTLNWLKERSGIRDEAGNFSQAGFNKALDALDKNNNLRVIFNPESANSLQALGRVARYTQAQPKGSYVNTSNTMVSQMVEKAANLAEAGANIVGGGKFGVPIGSMVRQKVQAVKSAREVERALEPGAGAVKKD